MPVVVHLKNGLDKQLRLAHSCAWIARPSGQAGPRWLVCKNERGDILATFEEPEINGFRIVPPAKTPRLRFPRFRNRTAISR
jgi:hypothetical protein